VLAADFPIGAIVMRWQPVESEIFYIAMEPDYRGQGLGKLAIQQIVNEARRRALASILVGTANSALENIAFYEKCGFRIDSVRKDYFNYFTSPIHANGILIRDMLMLRYDFGA
jgi:ribosomal protein S18 acetylase RimI-like enzyme